MGPNFITLATVLLLLTNPILEQKVLHTMAKFIDITDKYGHSQTYLSDGKKSRSIREAHYYDSTGVGWSCSSNSECSGHLACVNKRCVNPCQGVCGANINCETKNHVPACLCPPGFTGNPFAHCTRIRHSEPCHPSPCGRNTKCRVIGNTPSCECLPGFYGSPLAGCRHECDSDTQCRPEEACIDFKCQSPCTQCGVNAVCEVVQNHVPVCKCPRNYYGNPLSSCQSECYFDSDCPPELPSCLRNTCRNPCDGVCGINADCKVRNSAIPVCSCPVGMTGDPFVTCRPIEQKDLCEPNPCGANAKCQAGYNRDNQPRPVCTCFAGYNGDATIGCTIDLCHPNPCGVNAKCELGYDKSNNERAVCKCLPFYNGNPLSGCAPGECIQDSECLDDQACLSYKCENPCQNKCGINATCIPKKHAGVCTCLPGHEGDAKTRCHIVQRTHTNFTNFQTFQNFTN